MTELFKKSVLCISSIQGVTPEAALALALAVSQQRGAQQPSQQAPPPPPQHGQPPTFGQGASHGLQQQAGVKEWTWNTGKMQIPTNPRLAGSFAGKQKPLPKEPPQPAYVKVDAHKGPDAKPGGDTKANEFPPALRGYVQRCFERCKTDEQRKGVELVLQEVSDHAHFRGAAGAEERGGAAGRPICKRQLVPE